MPVSNPPVWTDPTSSVADVAAGGIWTSAAVDILCSDLAALGGGDGVSGLAGKANLLVNGGFELWQRGTSFTISSTAVTYTADRWYSALGGTSSLNVTQNTGNAGPRSQYACALTYTHQTASQFGQKLEFWQVGKGQAVSLSMLVTASVANAVRILLYDGTQNYYSAYHPGDGLAHVLTVTATLSVAATTLNALVSMEASGTFILDNATLVTGSMPAPGWTPEDPAVALARCQRYYEIVGAPSSQAVVIAGIATTGAQTAYATIPFRATKAVNPTVTVAGNFTLTNASGQPTRFASDATAVVLALNSTAAGQFQAVSTGASNAVVAEANP